MVAFVYDGDGNRVVRTQAGVTTRYLIDDLTPTGYAQVAEELTAGAVSRRYTHGSLRISQSQLINGNWTTHYYGYDGGGMVRQLFDTAGVVSDTYDYDAFGSAITSTGSTPNTFLYRGEHYDSTLDMYYLRARWYWPKVGRIVTADRYEARGPVPCNCNDPWVLAPSTTAHLYTYAYGDPVDLMDPTGLDSFLTYSQLRRILVRTGIQAHHIIEARLARNFVGSGCLHYLAASIPVSPKDHQPFTNAWGRKFPDGTCATPREIIDFAMHLYADHPEILEWLKRAF